LDFYLYSSQSVQSIENNLQYLFHPFANSNFNIVGASNLENRLSFNQESNNAMLNLGMSISQKSLTHSFTSDYQSVFDASDLEPSPYINKTATLGYAIAYEPLDSLSLQVFTRGLLRREQDRYVAGAFLSSQGYWIGSNLRTAFRNDSYTAGISGNAERKKMDWEAFELAQVNAYFNLYGGVASLNTYANYSYRTEDIYILVTPDSLQSVSSYRLSDEQLRRSLDVSGNVQIYPTNFSQLQISDLYSQNHTSYSNSEIRNNADYFNLAQSKLQIQLLPRLDWETDVAHSYAIKDYRNNLNTRHTEVQHLSSRLAWEYAELDSLIALASLDLQTIKFPDDANRWDNDLLARNYKIGWKHYWHSRIRLGTWLGYGEREDVYIDSLLSANNKFVTSYTLAPECSILLGDRLAFHQVYQIRADYSDYIYQTANENTFYRQLGFKYNLVFDTFPFIARSQDSRWLKLPYRNSPDNALRLDFGFAYEENQYATEKTGYYQLNTKNRKWVGSVSFRHDIRSFYWSLTPKYTWGTWTEYAAVFAWAWEFNNLSIVEFNLSPYGDSPDNIDWRSSVTLSLRF